MADLNFIRKNCRSCKQEKPLIDYHRDKSSKDGLCALCKVCNCAHVKRMREANPEKTKIAKRKAYLANREEVLVQQKEYRVANKQAINARDRKNYQENGKESAAKWARSYYLQNKERIKDKNRSWAKSNPERRSAMRMKWNDKNPEMKVLWDANRRANEKKATPSWANLFFIAEAYRLAKLREKVCGGSWHVDHMVPIQSKLVCGLHVEHNLSVIPGPENMRKSNRHWPGMP